MLRPICKDWGKNQRWPQPRQDDCISATFLGVPSTQHRPSTGPDLGKMDNPCLLGVSSAQHGGQIRNAQRWERSLHNLYLLGGHKCSARGKIRNGPNMGKMAS